MIEMDSKELIQFAACLTRAHSKEDCQHQISHELARWNQAESCDIFYREGGDTLVLKASTLAPEYRNRLKLGRGIGLVGIVLQQESPTFIGKDAQRDPNFAKYPGIDHDSVEALAIVPMIDETNQVFGVVVVRWNRPQDFTETRTNSILESITVASSLLRGFAAAYHAGADTNRLGALNEVSKTITKSPYLEEILQLLVHLTAQQFNYRVCTVRLLDEKRGELVLRATQAPAKAYQKKRAIALGESIAGRAISENRSIIVRDVRVEEDYIGHDLAVEQGLRSMICVPLMVQGRPVGVLTCYTGEVREFPPDEVKALETLAKQAALSIEHAKLQVRNTLMQEMHHRVKNNLQQVASLLRLQMRHSQYKSLEEALNDCLGRILAISAVHDLLSREDLDHVGIRSIAESLVHHQQSSLILPDKKIRFEVRGEDVRLNMAQATQIALVLNELIQNAIEHGFKHAHEGEIHITVEEKQEEEDERGLVAVWVANNGDPLPLTFDPTVESHLGLKIVDNLARSLLGKFKMETILGWTVSEVKFHRATSE